MAATNNRVPPIGSNVITTDDVYEAGYDYVPLMGAGMLKVQSATVDGDLTIKGDTEFDIVPMSFTTSPAGSTVAEGGDISVSVAVAGGIAPYTYEWFRQNTKSTYPVVTTSTLIDPAKNATAATANLVIEDATAEDAGTYWVRVRDSADNIIASGDSAVVKVGEDSSAVAVTGVTMSPATTSVVVGNTRQLNATVAPSDATNKAVTYESSDTAIATVNANGLVTGVAAGSATVTVTTADGAKTATTAVTVTAA